MNISEFEKSVKSSQFLRISTKSSDDDYNCYAQAFLITILIN